MSPAERAFYKLLAELASDGLFVDHPDASERIIAAFEAALETEKTASPREGASGHKVDQQSS